MSLVVVENDLPQEITELYDLMVKCGTNKYKKDKQRYESYLDKINQHNDDVAFINLKLIDFDYDTILENPTLLTTEKIEDYARCRQILKELKKYPDNCKEFLKVADSIVDDYECLCFEYELFNEYKKLLSFNGAKYINIKEKNEILDKASTLLNKLDKKDGHYYDYNLHNNIDFLINENNELYLSKTSKDTIFGNINGCSLDEEQRKSVLTDEQSVLVVAGAGSGKTLTICGKVNHLIKNEGVDPEDILLLSYSKKSAEDLNAKVSKINDKLNVGTFHKIGLDILKDTKKSIIAEDKSKEGNKE